MEFGKVELFTLKIQMGLYLNDATIINIIQAVKNRRSDMDRKFYEEMLTRHKNKDIDSEKMWDSEGR